MTNAANPCLGGLRHNGIEKYPDKHKPLITIITSTYNAAEQLPATIESIRSQSYQNLEWLVIDGASTDGTLDVLGKNQDVIDCWLSEPDKGIYDAWNKALPLVRGDWVMFLGAGDTLADNEILEKISPTLAKAKGKYSIVYGKVALLSPREKKVLSIIGEPWGNIANVWEYGRPKLPYHQGVIHDSNLYSSGMSYDTSYRIAADGKLLLDVLKREKKFLYTDNLISNMIQDGVSSDPKNMMACFREFIRSSKETGLEVPLIHRLSVYMRILIKGVLFSLFPEQWYESVIRLVRLKILKRTDYPD